MKIEIDINDLNELFHVVHNSVPTKHTVGEVLNVTSKIKKDVEEQIQAKQGGDSSEKQDVQHLKVEKTTDV